MTESTRIKIIIHEAEIRAQIEKAQRDLERLEQQLQEAAKPGHIEGWEKEAQLLGNVDEARHRQATSWLMA